MDAPELLPCFCGGTAEAAAGFYGRKFECSNEKCRLYLQEWYPQDWNALQTEIATVSDARVAAQIAIHEDVDDGQITVDFLNSSGLVVAGLDILPDGKIVASIVGGESDTLIPEVDARVAAARAEGREQAARAVKGYGDRVAKCSGPDNGAVSACAYLAKLIRTLTDPAP